MQGDGQKTTQNLGWHVPMTGRIHLTVNLEQGDILIALSQPRGGEAFALGAMGRDFASDSDGDGDVDLVEFKIIMRAGPKMGIAAVAKVTSTMTDPDEMMLMLRNAREELEGVDIMERLRGEGVEPEVKKALIADIDLRLTPQTVKIRAGCDGLGLLVLG